MKKALEEAQKGIGLTAPNPPVGAVLVHDDVLLASGWHKQAGAPHAERVALEEAAAKDISRDIMKESTLYVTLEPCSTYGKTPPCTEAIIRAGVGRVVYGIKDPNKNHSGAADAILNAAGVEVLGGIGEEACRRILRPFTMVQTQGRPWVIAKTAYSLDGKVSRPSGECQWISGAEARLQVHELRAKVDAIITGGATVRYDNPALTIRGVPVAPWKKQPIRAVITRSIDHLPLDAALFTDEFKDRTRIYENIPMEEMLKRLASEEQVQIALLETGNTLMKEFLDLGLVDEWIAYISPLICGGPYPAESSELDDFHFPWSPVPLKEVSITRTGRDICLRGIVDRKRNTRLE